MMRRFFSLLAVGSLTLASGLPAAGQDSPSPSLGDLARQVQKDRDRNKADKSAAKTLTNDDLSFQGGSSDTGGGIVAVAGKPWGIQMDLSGFTITSNGTKPDGRRYLLARNDNSQVVVSVTLEEVARGKSSASCEDIMRSRTADTPQNGAVDSAAGIEKKNPKIWQQGDKSFLEYLIPSMKGPGGAPVPINQENRFLCFVHDDVFVDVHASKADFHEGDEKLLDAVFDSIQIHAGVAAAATQSSLEYFKAGSARFVAQDFRGAIPPYAQALALEQRDRKLEKKYWYVLVDNLGMAYGISGDLEAARKTFQYGIETDPNYPLFYYEMADYYGEKGDVQNAIVYLKKAYERKANLIPGETMPDPREDDSFKALLNNKEFRDAVDALAKNN